MLFGLSYLRMGLLGGFALVAWLAYGWGSEIITNYGNMAAKIERLERDKRNVESRVASYQTLLARRDAAIEASACKVVIQDWVKNPDKIPTKWDPFNPFFQGGKK